MLEESIKDACRNVKRGLLATEADPELQNGLPGGEERPGGGRRVAEGWPAWGRRMAGGWLGRIEPPPKTSPVHTLLIH